MLTYPPYIYICYLYSRPEFWAIILLCSWVDVACF